MRPDKYAQVVVVGAGPAGLLAALTLAREGRDVILVDRKRQVGVPVRCAEGVGREALQEYVPLRPQWISATIRTVRLVAPSGEYVQLGRRMDGLVLDRVVFEEDLARQAAAAGARIFLNTYAGGLLMGPSGVEGLRLECDGQHRQVGCRLVIAADGVESRVARWAGIDTALALKDVETCAQYLLEDIDVDETRCDFFFGRREAPGGYAWVFPKGSGRANVGLGISGREAAGCSAKELLDRFVTKHYPQGRKAHFVAGGVPVSRSLRKPYASGLLVVGDAARQANPLSGGGIIPALEAGRLAAQVAHRSLSEGDVSEKALSRYRTAWNRSLGRSQNRYYRLKETVSRLPDRTLESTARALQDVDPEHLTLFRVFATALRRHPRLILDARYLFLPSV